MMEANARLVNNIIILVVTVCTVDCRSISTTNVTLYDLLVLGTLKKNTRMNESSQNQNVLLDVSSQYRATIRKLLEFSDFLKVPPTNSRLESSRFNSTLPGKRHGTYAVHTRDKRGKNTSSLRHHSKK